MINWKTGLILFAIFLAGGIAGGFVGMRVACSPRFMHGSSHGLGQRPPHRPVEEWSKRFERDLNKRVGVTADQRAKLDPLIEQAQKEFRQLRAQAFEKGAEISAKFDRDVLAVLTDEQKSKYEELVKERQERLKKIEAGRGFFPKPGFPPPGEPPPPPEQGHVPHAPAGDTPGANL